MAVYTIQEAADQLRLPYRVVRDAVFQGRWPHVKVSARRRLMTDEDIQATLEMLRSEPADPILPSAERSIRKNVQELLRAA